MFKGIPAVDGYGIGNVFIIKQANISFTPKSGCKPDKEWKRYKKAIEQFSHETKISAQEALATLGKNEADILFSYIAMGEDLYLNNEIHRLIENGECAESAISNACDAFISMLYSSEDEIFKQRAADLVDIKNTVLAILLGKKRVNIADVPPESVLVADAVTPSILAQIKKENISAIITETGGKTSHAAIIASTLSIPTVLALKGATEKFEDSQRVIVDGFKGIIISDPQSAQIEYYRRKKNEYLKQKQALSAFIDKPTVSADNKKYKLLANISSEQEVNLVLENGAEGIGLFRSEFLFLNRDSAPSEREQFNAYKQAIIQMGQKEVTIRLLDVSEDKQEPYLLKKTNEPIFSLRGVRYLLKNKSVLRTQLRAILRASAFGNVKILIPFVTDVQEIVAVRKMIDEICLKLDSDGMKYKKDIQVGVMIETPAAALCADILATQADFFSVGTNDLIQYTLIVDRGTFSDIYSPFAPAILRTIQSLCKSARKAKKSVCICGEAAADLSLVPLFMAAGVNELSVAPRKVLPLRKEFSKYDVSQAKKIAEKVMSLENEEEIRKYLK